MKKSHNRFFFKRRLEILSSALVFLTGCAFIPLGAGPPPGSQGNPELLSGGWKVYAGAIHVHSRHSHDAWTPTWHIYQAAENAGLDYLVLTDHDNMNALEDKRPEYPLVIIGEEVTTREGHIIALGIEQPVASGQSAEATIEEVRAQGGLSFISHPYADGFEYTHPSFSQTEGWKQGSRLNGMEIYNLPDDVRLDFLPAFVVASALLPYRPFIHLFHHVPPRPLRQWDKLGQTQRFAGIGGNDAHGKIGVGFAKLDHYRANFTFVQTYVLVKDFSQDAVLEALAEGRAFVCFGIYGNPRGFDFWAEQRDMTLPMGSEVRREDKVTLHLRLPDAGKAKILRNGKVWKAGLRASAEFEISTPGVYRAEVKKGVKVWILSNPIYIR